MIKCIWHDRHFHYESKYYTPKWIAGQIIEANKGKPWQFLQRVLEVREHTYLIEGLATNKHPCEIEHWYMDREQYWSAYDCSKYYKSYRKTGSHLVFQDRSK